MYSIIDDKLFIYFYKTYTQFFFTIDYCVGHFIEYIDKDLK